MAIDTVVNSIKLDDWADNGKVPVYNNTTKEFEMATPWWGSWLTQAQVLSRVYIGC